MYASSLSSCCPPPLSADLTGWQDLPEVAIICNIKGEAVWLNKRYYEYVRHNMMWST